MAIQFTTFEAYLNRKEVAWLRSFYGDLVIYGIFEPEMDPDGRFLTVSPNADGTYDVCRQGPGGYKGNYWKKHQRAEFKETSFDVVLAGLRWLGYSL